MIKKLFDWTPRDIAYWEVIRQKGLGYFILWYALVITGGLVFIVLGGMNLFGWIRQAYGTQITRISWIFLAGQLIFLALVCLIAGIANSLITWVVEQRLYCNYRARGSA